MQLDINHEDRESPAGVIDSYLSDFRMELSNTDSTDVLEILKKRKAVLQKVRSSIGGP